MITPLILWNFWNRLTPRGRVGVIAIPIVLVLLIVFMFKSCAKSDSAPTLNEPQIQNAISNMKEREYENLGNMLNSSQNRANALDAESRKAEANTKAASNVDYSNQSTGEVGNRLKGRLR